MAVYFVCVQFVFIHQVYAFTVQNVEDTSQYIPEESDTVVPRANRVVRLVYHPVKQYHKAVYNVQQPYNNSSGDIVKSQHQDKQPDIHGDEYLKLVQEKVNGFEIYLQQLKNQIKPELNQSTILEIIIEIDKKLSELKQMSLQSLPVKIQRKIGKLEQSVDNIKTTILSLIQNQDSVYNNSKVEENKITNKKGNRVMEFETWVNSLENIMENMAHTPISKKDNEDMLRIGFLIRQVLNLVESIGTENTPDTLLELIKHLQLTVQTYFNSLLLSNQEYTVNDSENKTEILSKQDYFDSVEGELKKILEFLKHQLVNKLPHVTQIAVHDSKPNKKNKQEVSHIHKPTNANNDKKSKIVKRLDIVTFPKEEIHDQSKIILQTPKNLEMDYSLTLVERWVNKLENYLLLLKNASNIDGWTILQLNFQIDQILAELRRLDEHSIPETLLNKVSKLKEKIENIKYIVSIKIHNETDASSDNKNMANGVEEGTTNNELNKHEGDIMNLEKILENIKTQLISYEPGQLNISNINLQAEYILDQLREFKSEDLPEELRKRVEKLGQTVHNYKNEVSLITGEEIINPQLNKQIAIQNDKSIKMINDQFSKLENDLERLINLIHFKQDTITLKQTHSQVHKILADLKEIEETKLLPEDVKNKIIILKQNVNEFKEKIQSISKIKNQMKNNGLKKVQELVKNLEDYLGQIERNKVSEADKLTLFQINFNINQMLFELKKMDVDDIPDKLLNKLNTLQERIKTIKNLQPQKQGQKQIKKKLVIEPSKVRIDTKVSIIEEKINNMEKNFENLKILLNSPLKQDLPILHKTNTEVDKMLDELKKLADVKLLAENVKNKLDQLRNNLVKFKSELKILNAKQNKNRDDSLKEVQYWVDNLDIYLGQLHNIQISDHDKFSILQIKTHINNILAQIRKPGIENLPEKVLDQVNKLQDKIMAIDHMSLNVQGNVSSIKNELIPMEETKVNNNLERKINTMEKYLEELRIQIISHPSIELNSNEINSQIRYILEELKNIYVSNIPNKLQNRVKQLEQNVRDYKRELQSTIQKQKLRSELNNKEYFKNYEGLNVASERIQNLMIDLKRLISKIHSQANLLVLMNTNIQLFDIINELKELEEVIFYPESLKNNITNLLQNVEGFKNEVKSLINEKKILNTHNEEDNQFLINTANNYVIVEGLIFSLKTDLETLHDQLKYEQGEWNLMQINIQAHQILIKLQKLAREKVTINGLQRIIHTLSQECEHLIVKVESIIMKQKKMNENGSYKKPKSSSIITVIEEQIIGFENELESSKSKLDAGQDLPTTIHIYNQIHHILTDLQKLDLQTIPSNIVLKVKRLISIAKDLKNRIEKIRSNEKIKMPVKLDVIRNENYENIAFIEKQIESFYYTLDHMREMFLTSQDESTVTYIFIEINKMLIQLEQLEVKTIPNSTILKITELIQFTKSFRDNIESLITKQTSSDKSFKQDKYTHLEEIVQERINSLVIVLNHIKRTFLFEQDQSTIIHIYNKVDQILEEIKHLKIQNVGDNLSNNIRILEENCENFKLVVESIIRSKILNTMEIYIDELLYQIESSKVSRFLVVTSAKISAIKEDLLLLKEDIHSLTNFNLIKQLHYRIEAVVAKLDELKTHHHLSGFLDRAITGFKRFLRDII